MARAHWHSHHWGGRRPGAGRPVLQIRTRRISITLPEDVLQALQLQADRRQMSRSALLAYYLVRGMEK
jgi:hypothetical protein